VLGETVKRQC